MRKAAVVSIDATVQHQRDSERLQRLERDLKETEEAKEHIMSSAEEDVLRWVFVSSAARVCLIVLTALSTTGSQGHWQNSGNKSSCWSLPTRQHA